MVLVSRTAPPEALDDLDLLAATFRVEITRVEGDVVRLTVVQIDRDREAGGGIPDCGDAVRAPGNLEARTSDDVVVQV